MSDTQASSAIVGADGRPLRRQAPVCPGCGADLNTRTFAGGIGRPRYPVCRTCGHEWPDEVYVTKGGD